MTVHATNREARKRLEASVGKEVVREFVAHAVGCRIVITDAKEHDTDWDVFIVPQITACPDPTPWKHKISEDPTITLVKTIGGEFHAIKKRYYQIELQG